MGCCSSKEKDVKNDKKKEVDKGKNVAVNSSAQDASETVEKKSGKSSAAEEGEEGKEGGDDERKSAEEEEEEEGGAGAASVPDAEGGEGETPQKDEEKEKEEKEKESEAHAGKEGAAGDNSKASEDGKDGEGSKHKKLKRRKKSNKDKSQVHREDEGESEATTKGKKKGRKSAAKQPAKAKNKGIETDSSSFSSAPPPDAREQRDASAYNPTPNKWIDSLNTTSRSLPPQPQQRQQLAIRAPSVGASLASYSSTSSSSSFDSSPSSSSSSLSSSSVSEPYSDSGRTSDDSDSYTGTSTYSSSTSSSSFYSGGKRGGKRAGKTRPPHRRANRHSDSDDAEDEDLLSHGYAYTGTPPVYRTEAIGSHYTTSAARHPGSGNDSSFLTPPRRAPGGAPRYHVVERPPPRYADYSYTYDRSASYSSSYETPSSSSAASSSTFDDGGRGGGGNGNSRTRLVGAYASPASGGSTFYSPVGDEVVSPRPRPTEYQRRQEAGQQYRGRPISYMQENYVMESPYGYMVGASGNRYQDPYRSHSGGGRHGSGERGPAGRNPQPHQRRGNYYYYDL